MELIGPAKAWFVVVCGSGGKRVYRFLIG